MSDSRLTVLGAILRTARENAQLSQRRLASLTGLHHTYLGKLEAGRRRPSMEALQRLAAVLNFDATEVVARLGLTSPALPSPRLYFRRKFGVSESEADILVSLVEHELADKQETR